MPYVRCPVCNEWFHLSIRIPHDEWEREHVRERDANGIPLLKCIRCWVELRPGHRITLRQVLEASDGVLAVGQEGVVEAGAEMEGGDILVRFGETLASFKREDLSYVPGQPPPESRNRDG